MTSPIPIVSDYRRVIYDNLARREVDLGTRPSREDHARRASFYVPLVEKFVPADRSSRILELGSGWGAFLAALKGRGYERLEAVEVARDCALLTEEYVGVTPACVDIVDYLGTAEGPYDVIAAFDVIEHFTKNEIVALLTRIHELLRPGGMFVMRVPNCSSIAGLSSLFGGFTHETGFTSQSADEVLRAMGFADVTCIPEPVFARNEARAVLKRAWKRGIGVALHYATAGALDPRFAASNNLIAAGRKP